ncbi:VanZ family protein [Kitasatospora nipponensis]|uniref:VanZ family protein n=1 Tax=Kitasatospora nipponensis TaxID=258049 RepID=UPI0031DC1231
MRLRLLGAVLLALYLLVAGWFALRSTPTGPWAYDANLTPFSSIHRALALGSTDALRALAGPLLGGAPLGVLLPLVGGRLRRAWLPSFLQAAAASGVIATALEVLQTWLGTRILNVDDVLLAVFGAALAHLAVVPYGRAALRTHGRSVPRGAPAPAPATAPATAPAGPAPATRTTAGPTAPQSAAPTTPTVLRLSAPVRTGAPASVLTAGPVPAGLVEHGRR